MQRRLLFSVIFLSLIIFSCNPHQVEEAVFSQVNKNACGMLVFKDSIAYMLIYDLLESKQEAYDSTAPANTTDEEKPLTDFETLKNHYSYRRLIKDQEDAAENNGVDLSVNPVAEILDDDEILQTLLNKDRMMVIDSTVYYYFDDCTLFKFPLGADCKKSIDIALAYFKNYDYNIQHSIKPTFLYEKIDICNGEENYRAVQDICQDMQLEFCVANPCHPEIVEFFMYFPGLDQYSMYTLDSFKYRIGTDSQVLNVNNASLINSTSCGLTIGARGYTQTIDFPAADSTYGIKITGLFHYTQDNTVHYCRQQINDSIHIGLQGCAINSPVTINGLNVTIADIDNPCNAQGIGDTFSFVFLVDTPIILAQTHNTIKLKYDCEGDKKVKIIHHQGACNISKIITVHPVDPSICCVGNARKNCTQSYTSGNYKIKVKLKERNNRLVGIVKNFKGSKRTTTHFNGDIIGPVYYYKNACNCEGIVDFSKHKAAHRKKIRIKFKFRSIKSNIESLAGVSSFSWFKHNWSRKKDVSWKLAISTSEIANDTVRIINCAGSATCSP